MCKEFQEFLERETPSYNGCMVCKFIDENGDPKFRLVVRIKIANGDLFLINGYFSYDIEFEWEKYPNWEIIYKYEGTE